MKPLPGSSKRTARNARVVGDISSPRVGIAPGALARGHVQTDGERRIRRAAVGRCPAKTSRPNTAPIPMTC